MFVVVVVVVVVIVVAVVVVVVVVLLLLFLFLLLLLPLVVVAVAGAAAVVAVVDAADAVVVDVYLRLPVLNVPSLLGELRFQQGASSGKLRLRRRRNQMHCGKDQHRRHLRRHRPASTSLTDRHSRDETRDCTADRRL